MSATPPSTSSPKLPADEFAAREWPPLRARLVDIAAAMDRLDRAGQPGSKVRAEAERIIRCLLEPSDSDRAQRVLELLSLDYDPSWQERFAADA